MDTAEIESKVKSIIQDQMSCEYETIVPEARFIEDLHCDSLDMIELVLGFEDAFDIEIPDGEVEHIKTVGQAVEEVENRVNNK